jgi:polysaccharide biosynthesis/export protein
MNKKSLFKFSWIAFIAIIFFSCTPQKKLVYLQQQAQQADVKQSENKSPDYIIRTNDILYVKINSINEEAYDFFNNSNGQNTVYSFQSPMAIYFSSYTVNDSGYIILPVVGNIVAKDKSLNQVQQEVQNEVNKYLKEATVIVKLANYHVTLIGDVTRPGVYTFYQDKVNILEAIGTAGDLTVYGNRTKIMLIRKNNGIDKVTYVNLLDRDLLNKPEYNILPNDVIYVEPNKNAKSLGFATFPWSLMLSTISTVVAVIALTTK